MIMRKNGIGCLLTIFLLFTTILSAQQGQFINWKDYSGKVYVQLVDGMLQISPMAANAVRIQYQKSVNRQLPEWIYIDSLSNKAAYQIKDNSNEIRIKLSRMSVIVNKQTGQLTFRDSQGKKIFSENQRKLTPSLVQGENTYCAELHIESPEDEFLFGLGQFQDGYLNVRGLSRRLTQVNTQISIPFVLSNKGYGLLWNNYGLTDFNPSEQKIIFQKQEENGEKTSRERKEFRPRREEGSRSFSGDRRPYFYFKTDTSQIWSLCITFRCWSENGKDAPSCYRWENDSGGEEYMVAADNLCHC